MGSAKAIRGHDLVRLREDLQNARHDLYGQTKKKKGRAWEMRPYLSVFHPDGSKDVVRITDAIQRRNVTLIYGSQDIARGRGVSCAD